MEAKLPNGEAGSDANFHLSSGLKPVQALLSALNVLRFQSFVAGDHFKSDHLTLVQSFETAAHNGRVVHKDVLPGVLGDKAKPFFVIKPLNFTTSHNVSPERCPTFTHWAQNRFHTVS
jgi:hypothetical protein